MTKEAIKELFRAHSADFFDGYILVGRIAGTDEIVVDYTFDNTLTKAKLMIGVAQLLQNRDSLSADSDE